MRSTGIRLAKRLQLQSKEEDWEEEEGEEGPLGQRINITSTSSGSATDYTMSGTPRLPFCNIINDNEHRRDPIYDTGTVSITIGSFVSGGFTASAPYGNGSTPAPQSPLLSSAVFSSSSPVVASLNSSVILPTTIDAGSSADFRSRLGYRSSRRSEAHAFPNPSFLKQVPATR